MDWVITTWNFLEKIKTKTKSIFKIWSSITLLQTDVSYFCRKFKCYDRVDKTGCSVWNACRKSFFYVFKKLVRKSKAWNLTLVRVQIQYLAQTCPRGFKIQMSSLLISLSHTFIYMHKQNGPLNSDIMKIVEESTIASNVRPLPHLLPLHYGRDFTAGVRVYILVYSPQT